jgi:hypothetical protein
MHKIRYILLFPLCLVAGPGLLPSSFDVALRLGDTDFIRKSYEGMNKAERNKIDPLLSMELFLRIGEKNNLIAQLQQSTMQKTALGALQAGASFADIAAQNLAATLLDKKSKKQFLQRAEQTKPAGQKGRKPALYIGRSTNKLSEGLNEAVQAQLNMRTGLPLLRKQRDDLVRLGMALNYFDAVKSVPASSHQALDYPHQYQSARR